MKKEEKEADGGQGKTQRCTRNERPDTEQEKKTTKNNERHVEGKVRAAGTEKQGKQEVAKKIRAAL